jgi:hypothetical protein
VATDPTAEVAVSKAPPAPEVAVENAPAAPEVAVEKAPAAPEVAVSMTPSAKLVKVVRAPSAPLLTTLFRANLSALNAPGAVDSLEVFAHWKAEYAPEVTCKSTALIRGVL